MRPAYLVVAFACLGLVAFGLPGSSVQPGDNDCRTLTKFGFGTGEALIDEPALNGINHVDVAYPSCTGGQFSVEFKQGKGHWQNHCDGRFARVYAPVGEIDIELVITWKTDSPPPAACV